jgi:hypothetical protein
MSAAAAPSVVAGIRGHWCCLKKRLLFIRKKIPFEKTAPGSDHGKRHDVFVFAIFFILTQAGERDNNFR